MGIRDRAIAAYRDKVAEEKQAEDQWVLDTFGFTLDEFAADGLDVQVCGNPVDPSCAMPVYLAVYVRGRHYTHYTVTTLVELGELLYDIEGGGQNE